MGTTPDRREAAEQRRRKNYRQHFEIGRIALLVLTAVSVFNQLLLLLKVGQHVFISAAVPYYLNWFAQRLGGSNGVTFLKVIALLVTLACYGGYTVCWMQSAHQKEYLKTAMLLYALDTVVLLIMAFVLIENPASCILEILVHLVVLWLLYDGWNSARRLSEMDNRHRRRMRNRGGAHD